MKFFKTSKSYYLNKSTYINLRWIAIIGQFITINSVKFIFNFDFDYISANIIIVLGSLSNLYLTYAYSKSELSNRTSFVFLIIDIIQLSLLFIFTWVAVSLIFKYSSVSSMFASLTVFIIHTIREMVEPIFKVMSEETSMNYEIELSLSLLLFIFFILIIFTHRKNISNLKNKTEQKIKI